MNDKLIYGIGGLLLGYGIAAMMNKNTAAVGAKSYGNCTCKNGTQCVGSGDCSCCDKQAGSIHTVLLPAPKASWNCIKNPNGPGCNPTLRYSSPGMGYSGGLM